MSLKSMFVISGMVLSLTGAQAEEKKEFNLVEVCKKDCPTAKTDEDAHKCVEKLARLNKSFKKTKCWEVNEKFEAAQKEKPAQ